LLALVALTGLLPLAAVLLRSRSSRAVRGRLGLSEPSRPARLVRPAAIVSLFLLLGVAVAGPTVRREQARVVRRDVEVMVVLDSSISMRASAGPHAPERWQRAASFAARLQQELPGVPIGLSSLTNRLLPYLFPTSDGRAYDLVLRESYGIQRPPPAITLDRWVTIFEPLEQVAVSRFFSPGIHRRVLVVLSDAEARPFAEETVLHELERAGTEPVVVRFWRPGERIYDSGYAGYHATEAGALAALRRAGWPAFSERQQGAALRMVRGLVGSGPSVRVALDRREVSIGPYVASAAVVPLLLLVGAGTFAGAFRRRLPTELIRFRHNASARASSTSAP